MINQFILFCFKHALPIHFLIQIAILSAADVYPNDPVFYAFMLNTGLLIYFSIVRGIMIGIMNGEKILDDTKE